MRPTGKVIPLTPKPSEPEVGESVAALVVRMDRRLRAYLLRRTGDAADAADSVQEVYVRLTRIADGDPTAQFSNAYVFNTADSVATDLFRRRRARRMGDHVELKDSLRGSEPSPYDELRWRQTAEIMRRAVDALPADQRRVLLLHRVEGKTLPETARLIGAPLRTVERRLALALATCRGRLEEVGWFAPD